MAEYVVGDMMISDDLAESIAEIKRREQDAIIGEDEAEGEDLAVYNHNGIAIVLPETRAERRQQYKDIINMMTVTQRRFLTNLHITGGSVSKAAKLPGISPITPPTWKADWRRAYALSLDDAEMAAKEELKGALAKAVGTKIDLLDSPNERVRSRAASEIIEWMLGKAVAKNEISGTGGGPIQIDTRSILLQRLENIAGTSTESPREQVSGNPDDSDEII